MTVIENHEPIKLPDRYPPGAGRQKTISTHRAFVYGACAPGLGEIYAGSRLGGFLTASLFLICAGWFTLTLFTILAAVADRVFDSLNGMDPMVLPDLSFISLGISFFGIYSLWLWAMISAVDVACSHRQGTAARQQASVMWAVALSWFCPGSGQVYAADRRLGYILFAAYLMAILLSLPAYTQLYQGFSEIAKAGQLSANNPYGIIDIVHGLIARMNYGFGKLLQIGVRYFALAATLAALRQGPLAADNRWSDPSTAYSAALLGLGWLCPGCGQILQRRFKTGWYFLAGYLASKLLISFLLGHSFIAVQTADNLAWVTVLIQWAAMFEAPIWMIVLNSKKS